MRAACEHQLMIRQQVGTDSLNVGIAAAVGWKIVGVLFPFCSARRFGFAALLPYWFTLALVIFKRKLASVFRTKFDAPPTAISFTEIERCTFTITTPDGHLRANGHPHDS